MQLLLNGGAVRIVQMGPDFLLVENPFDHPPTESASVVFQVDDQLRRWNVVLPEGLSAGSKRVTIAARI